MNVKRIVIGGGLLIAVVAVVLGTSRALAPALGANVEFATPSISTMPHDPAAGPALRAGSARLTSRRIETLGSGNTLAEAIERFELPSPLGRRIVAALGGQLDARRLSPRTSFLFERLDEHHSRLAVRDASDRFVRLEWRVGDGELQRVERVELPTRTTIEVIGGVVESSLYQALSGHPAELTLAFADIFQWDIDLLVEPRPGDRVRVVYEAHWFDELPDDLPPFGETPTDPGSFLRVGRVLAASYDGRLASSDAYWVEGSNNGAGGFFDADGAPLQKTFLKSPLNYRRISSRFSRARRHPVTRRVVPHHGVDFAAAAGTPVVAAADGRVSKTGWQGALGRAVRMRHGSEYETVYGHLSRIAKGVRPGAEVKQNQVIGYVGSTGRATGPHLHYTLIAHGRPVDPLGFENPPAGPLEASLRPELAEVKLAFAPLLGSIPFDVASAPSAGSESVPQSGG